MHDVFFNHVQMDQLVNLRNKINPTHLSENREKKKQLPI